MREFAKYVIQIQLKMKPILLFSCSSYVALRENLYQSCLEHFETFQTFQQDRKLLYLMDGKWKFVLEFVYKAWEKRKSILFIKK